MKQNENVSSRSLKQSFNLNIAKMNDRLFVCCMCDHSCPVPTIILGRVAYLGVLSLRSAVNTAGELILIVSSPPSISLTTLIFSPSNETSDAKVPCKLKTPHNFSGSAQLMEFVYTTGKKLPHLLVQRWNYNKTKIILEKKIYRYLPYSWRQKQNGYVFYYKNGWVLLNIYMVNAQFYIIINCYQWLS